ncbi:6-phosphofructo-2-kinase/fructose-2,6-bisphosphatase-like [Pyrus communis]|uniref:6-phosphofructo-2-kinase/fructose-2, 6-bisphosphatase-like n=1 Tax=Pyrus communis TaxID=23211 RepID=UPI0035C16190
MLLTRHGESKDNVRGRIGGDNPLSDTGEIYAQKLANFVEKRLKSERATCCIDVAVDHSSSKCDQCASLITSIYCSRRECSIDWGACTPY